MAEKTLVDNYRSGDIFILSMDFSHGKTPFEAAREDERSVTAIMRILRGRDYADRLVYKLRVNFIQKRLVYTRVLRL